MTVLACTLRVRCLKLEGLFDGINRLPTACLAKSFGMGKRNPSQLGALMHTKCC